MDHTLLIDSYLISIFSMIICTDRSLITVILICLLLGNLLPAVSRFDMLRISSGFINWDGLWCPCCGYRLTTNPRTLKYKDKLRDTLKIMEYRLDPLSIAKI